MSHYAAGRRLEYIARDELRAQGYTVIRSAGSKGAVDLIAIRSDDVRLIQVKAEGHASRIGSAARKLAALPCPAGVRREVWEWKGRAGWAVTPVESGRENAS